MSIKPTQPIVLGKPTAHISIICATGALTASRFSPAAAGSQVSDAGAAASAPIPICSRAPIPVRSLLHGAPPPLRLWSQRAETVRRETER